MEYVEGDPKFVRRIMDAGGGTLKKCFQCATCSVVCPLSPDENPFPRKEMIWAQWGLKEKLMADSDVWLCHQCNDCSSYCPRGAKPGEVLGALRNIQISQYSFPGFLAQAFTTPRYIWAIYALPILLLAAYFSIFGFHIPEGEVHFSHFIPHQHVELAGMIMGGYIGIAILVGLYRFWTAMGGHEIRAKEKSEFVDVGTQVKGGFIPSLIATIIEILTHNRFGKCGESKYRYFAHLGIFYGFILIFIGTNIAFAYLLMGRELNLPLTDPAKIFGNIGFILLFGGASWVIYERVVKRDTIGIGGYFDWLFLGTLWLVAFSGIVLEALRFANSIAAYWIYLVHLVVVFVLLAYAPYSKFAHLAYRTIAMTYAKYSGKDTEKTQL